MSEDLKNKAMLLYEEFLTASPILSKKTYHGVSLLSVVFLPPHVVRGKEKEKRVMKQLLNDFKKELT